jgi:hypothetical protein
MVVRLALDAFQNDLVPKIDHFGGPDFGSIFAHQNRGHQRDTNGEKSSHEGTVFWRSEAKIR